MNRFSAGLELKLTLSAIRSANFDVVPEEEDEQDDIDDVFWSLSESEPELSPPAA